MLEQLFEIIETAATSSHAAIIISLALNVALAWGWWRREATHSSGSDRFRREWIEREKSYLECLSGHDDEIAAFGREAFTVLQDVAAALAGMERTLDGLETLVHLALNKKLYGDEKNENEK